MPTGKAGYAGMDIAVCREVFTHLISAAQTLGVDAGQVPHWQAILHKLPPYPLDTDKALKEWAWPTLEERLDHRHVSHLYGVWTADEITPDQTPELARAAWLAARKRGQGNASAHGIFHRSLARGRAPRRPLPRQLRSEANPRTGLRRTRPHHAA